MPLFNHSSLTIDGNRSTFLFQGQMVPLTIEGGEKITLKDFTIDWTHSFHAEVRIVESDPVNHRHCRGPLRDPTLDRGAIHDSASSRFP